MHLCNECGSDKQRLSGRWLNSIDNAYSARVRCICGHSAAAGISSDIATAERQAEANWNNQAHAENLRSA